MGATDERKGPKVVHLQSRNVWHWHGRSPKLGIERCGDAPTRAQAHKDMAAALADADESPTISELELIEARAGRRSSANVRVPAGFAVRGSRSRWGS